MCKLTTAQVVADGAAVGTALNNLGAALQATNPTVAADLEKAGAAVIAATQNWTEGSSLAILTDAEQAAIVVLDAIPLTSPYADLVAIAFTALNLLIANTTTQSTQTGNAMADAHTLLKAAAETKSPWQGKAQIKHNPLHSLRVNFENTWNEKAKPLGVAEVKV